MTLEKPKGSVVGGMFIMLLVSLVLFWLPVVGPILAGIIGGRKAGGVGNAILAAVLPALIVGTILFFLAGSLTGVPLLGAVAGIGGIILSLAHIGPLLLGAVIGGALA